MLLYLYVHTYFCKNYPCVRICKYLEVINLKFISLATYLQILWVWEMGCWVVMKWHVDFNS